MGFRFRKTLSLLPGVRLNISKSGASVSLGTRGATVNLSGRGAKGTVGLPGSGMSWSEQLSWDKIKGAVGFGEGAERPPERAGHDELPARDGWRPRDELPAPEPLPQLDDRSEAIRNADRELAKAIAAAEARKQQDVTERWRQLQPLPPSPQPAPSGTNAGDVVSAALEALDFPFETKCNVGVGENDEVFVLLDLPEIEDVVPEERTEVGEAGRPRKKRRTKRDRGRDYAHLVCGLALLMARTALAAAPGIEQVHIAAYTQRRKPKTGELQDDFVYEVALHRDEIAALDLAKVEPVRAVSDARSRIDYRETGDLKKIAPPKWAGDAR